MQITRILILVVLATPLFLGCGSSSNELTVDTPPSSFGGAGVVWVEKDWKHESTTVSLGYRDDDTRSDGWLEPIAMITRDGEFAADAMVFHSVVSTDVDDVVSEEVPTLYKNKEGESAGIYAEGKHKLAKDAKELKIRFRILLADHPEPLVREIKLAD